VTTWRDRASVHLIRRFLAGFFDPGELSESGAPGVARTIGGIAAVLLALGCLMARGFLKRYAMVNDTDAGGAAAYHAVALADHFFLIAIPMWIVAFVTVLGSSALFPDETDFRVLVPLPVSRRLIFGAKLAALAAFVGIFVCTAEASLAPLFTVTIVSPYLDHSLVTLFMSYLTASVAGAIFAALSVIAIHALLLLLVPRRVLAPASAAVTSLWIFGLVISLPFIGRFTATSEALSGGARWLRFVPPAWFAGLEQWMLGDSRFASRAAAAGVALAAAAVISAAAYLILYRHFERVIVRPAASGTLHRLQSRVTARLRRSGASASAAAQASSTSPAQASAFRAVLHFTSLTLRRSPLHQGLMVAIAAIGAAIVVNDLLGIDIPAAMAARPTAWRHRELVNAVVWAPSALVFVSTLAVRASLLVPIEPRANWIFRMTERPAIRLDQLDAAAWAMRTLGVAVPALALAPLQWWVIGPTAMATTLGAILGGAVLVEVIFLNWRRIPFTCSYVMGKSFMPLVMLKGLLAFLLFATAGAVVAHTNHSAPRSFAVAVDLLLAAAAFGLHRLRRQLQAQEPLEFEDLVPSEMNPLRLSGD